MPAYNFLENGDFCNITVNMPILFLLGGNLVIVSPRCYACCKFGGFRLICVTTSVMVKFTPTQKCPPLQ